MKKPLCFIFGLSVLMSCGGEQPKVDKIIEDGVEVVLNHFEPFQLKGQPSRLRLQEETRIDFEKAEYSGLGLKEPDLGGVDSKGNIFLIEYSPDSEYFIYKFNPDGRFSGKFGRKGQGPGEIQGIWSFLLEKNNNLSISDPSARKVVTLDSEGRLVKETKFAPGQLDVLPLPNGNFLARRYPKDDSEPRGIYLSLLGPDLKEAKLLDSYDLSEYAPGKKQFSFIVHFYWRVAGDKIYVGNGSRGYELQVWDINGNLLRKIRKEYRQVPYFDEFRLQTERAITAGDNSLVVAKEMLPVNSFFVDDAGRLFVMTYERGASPDEYIHDVFNSEGILTSRVSLGKYGILGPELNPLKATAINGRFYRLWYKESGFPELIVYQMMWE